MICDVLAPCGLSSLDLCQWSLRGTWLNSFGGCLYHASSETIIDVSLWCFVFLDSVIICNVHSQAVSFNPSGSTDLRALTQHTFFYHSALLLISTSAIIRSCLFFFLTFCCLCIRPLYVPAFTVLKRYCIESCTEKERESEQKSICLQCEKSLGLAGEKAWKQEIWREYNSDLLQRHDHDASVDIYI